MAAKRKVRYSKRLRCKTVRVGRKWVRVCGTFKKSRRRIRRKK